jgi:hypothetical protein
MGLLLTASDLVFIGLFRTGMDGHGRQSRYLIHCNEPRRIEQMLFIY